MRSFAPACREQAKSGTSGSPVLVLAGRRYIDEAIGPRTASSARVSEIPLFMWGFLLVYAAMTAEDLSGRELLRHSVATIAYRAGKIIRDAPPGYVDFDAGQKCRTPVQLLAHIGDLFEWALSMVKGQPAWNAARPQPWADEVQRFFDCLKRFDDYLASAQPLHASPDKLLQGPLADTLTHVGQLAILRRLAGVPIRGENYYRADISTGRVGQDQPAAKLEFD